MVDAVKIVADVGVQHVMSALGPELPQGLQRHRRITLRSKPVRARQKIRLEHRLQHQLSRHLDYSIPHRRYPERPLPSVSLRYVLATDHRRSILARPQHRAEFFQEALDPILLNVADRLAVDSRGAAVPPHSSPRLLQDVTPAKMVIQGVKTPTRCSLGCRP